MIKHYSLLGSLMVLAGLTSLSATAQDQMTTEPAPRSRTVNSGLALEPMLIYGQADANIRTSQLPIISDDTSGTSRSAGLGLKIGGHVGEVFILGIDGRYGRNRIADSSYGESEGNEYTLGPTVGIQMPVAGLRLLGTYVMAGDYDLDAGTQGFDVRFKDPEGYRAGVGFHIGSVSVNLEYEDIKFRTTEVQSVGGINTTTNTEVDYDRRGYLASLSFPMEL